MLGPASGWAVGCTLPDTTGGKFKPMVAHWNGRRWRATPLPAHTAGDVRLNGIAALTASNAWAGGDGNGSRPLIIRWNGPARDGRQLISATVLRGGHLAAVGNNLGPATTVALHALWNGRRWSVTVGPLNGTSLNGITTDGHNLWAVGSKDTSAARFVSLTEICHGAVTADLRSSRPAGRTLPGIASVHSQSARVLP
jgi:hypothetical protein